MAQVRTLDEVSALANAVGEAPHDGYILLKDGRQLRTRDEVLEWVHAMAAAAADDGAREDDLARMKAAHEMLP